MHQDILLRVRSYSVHERYSYLAYVLGGLGVIVPYNHCHFTLAIEFDGTEVEWELTWKGMEVREDRTYCTRVWEFNITGDDLALYGKRLQYWLTSGHAVTCKSAIDALLLKEYNSDMRVLTCMAFVEHILTGQVTFMAARPKQFISWLNIHEQWKSIVER